MRRFLLLVIDLFLVALATIFALVLRENFVISPEKFAVVLPYLGGTLLTAIVVLPVLRLNRGIWRLSGMPDYVRVVGAAVVIVLCAVGIGFANNRLDGIARSLPVLQGLMIVAALVGVRVLFRLVFKPRKQAIVDAAADRGNAHAPHETVLVVGLNSITELYLRSVAEFAPTRVQVAGLLGGLDRHIGRVLREHRILGTPEQVGAVLADLEVHGIFVDRIVITTPFADLSPQAREALRAVERASTIRLDFFAEHVGLDPNSPVRGAPKSSQGSSSVPQSNAPSFSALELTMPTRRGYWRMKRALSLVGAVLLVVLLAPIILVVGALVAIDLGLPVVFWQQRPGMGGRPFKLLKFRTMGPAHDWQGRRIADEHRVSAIGRFLRRSRLDELPQLYNILVGDMSFVGPRPLLPVDQSKEHNLRLLVRPGLTGWAQVNGGRAVSPEAKSALDVWYVRNASLALDLNIIWRTFDMLINGERLDERNVDRARDELSLVRNSGVSDAASLTGDNKVARSKASQRAVA